MICLKCKEKIPLISNIDLEEGNILFKIVHLKCTDATIRERAKHRRDNKQEVERRIISDGNDFCVMDIFADKIVWNNLDCELGDVVKEVLDYIEGEM